MKLLNKGYLTIVSFVILMGISFGVLLNGMNQIVTNRASQEALDNVLNNLRGIVIFMMIVSIIFIGLLTFLIRKNHQVQITKEKEKEFLQNVLDTIPLPIFIATDGDDFSFVNEACSIMFNRDCKETGTVPCSRWEPGICNTLNCTIRRIQTDLNATNYFEMEGKSYQVSASPFKNDEYKNRSFIEVIQDITDVTRIQNTLGDKTTELEAITENIACGILTTTLDDGFPIIRCNKEYCALIGEEADDVIGKTATNWIFPEDYDQTVETINQQFCVGDVVDLELRLAQNNKNGRIIFALLRGKKTIINGIQVCVWMLSDISDIKEAERKIKLSEELFRVAAENTEDIVIDYDVQTKTMVHTRKAMDIYGVPLIMHNVPESLLTNGTIAQQTIPQFLDIFKQIANGEEKTKCEILTRTRNNEWTWNRLSFTTIFDINHNPIRAIGIIQDINNEKEAKRKYEKEAKYRDITAQDLILSYEVDFLKGLFITGHEELTKAFYGEVINDYDRVTKLLLDHFIYKEDLEKVRDLTDYDLIKQRYFEDHAEKVSMEYRRLDKDGNPKWVECTYYLYEDENILKGLYFIRDIDGKKTREIELRRRAERDLLTGSYNKMTTEKLIMDFVKNNPAIDQMVVGAFMLIDLDNFKNINDSLGHAFGDAVLSEVARKIPTLFRTQDIVGRIGGDEFVVFMQYPKTMEVVEQRAQEVCEMFTNSYTGSGNYYKVSGTIGISLYPQQGLHFEDLYRKADIALYHAKHRGKDTYDIFSDEMSFNENQQNIERQIDDNYGKSFADNISEYILRILYESKEPKLAVRAILELITKHYNHGRGYIFECSKDARTWSNTFEWCANGIEQKIDEYQNIPIDDLTEYFKNFDEEGFFIKTVKDGAQFCNQMVTPSGVCSIAQCAITNQGVIKGFIGFDDCINDTIVSDEEKRAIKLVALLVGTFLINNDGIEGELFITEEIEKVMDSIDNYVYIIDNETYALRFFNQKTKSMIPTLKLGDYCYKALRGYDEPCKDCPKKGMMKSSDGKHRSQIYNEIIERTVDATISQVKWRDGSQCCLLNSFDVFDKLKNRG